MHSHKYRVLILMAGPKFDLEWEFGARLEGLSAFSVGHLITSGWETGGMRIGNFKVEITPYEEGSAVREFRTWRRYVARCLAVAREARRAGQPFDAVLTYDPLFTGAVGWVMARLLNAKLICEVNGEYTALANFMHIRARWRRGVRRRIARTLARFVLGRANGIRTLYPSQLDKLGYTARPPQVIAQFAEYVNTRAFANLGEEPVVLLVGFPFYVKGVDVAISAFRAIAPRFPAWRLVVMGYYPDKREIDAAIGGCPAILHHAPVHHRHMNEHIGRCGIVLQTSRTEAMGRVLVEAMAAAKPRIASNVGGIPTVVDDGRDGILVEPGDVGGVAAALERLMRDAALRRRLGEAGAVRAVHEFAPERYFRNVESLLAAVVVGRASVG